MVFVVKWVFHVNGRAPAAVGLQFGIPDVVTFLISYIFRMSFAGEIQGLAIGRYDGQHIISK